MIDSLPVDVFVDPHQVRELPLWGGPEVHVTTSAPEGRVDLEGPAWTGHSTAVLVRTRLNASEGAAAVEATFSYPLHFRYAMPKAGGGFATVPLIPPIAYLLHTGGATELAGTSAVRRLRLQSGRASLTVARSHRAAGSQTRCR